jgi:hypothetical protein
MKEVTILFDFLPYVKSIYPLTKQFNFYTSDEFQKEFSDDNSNWPGLRTQDLNIYSPFLYINILTLLQRSIKLEYTEYKHISMYCHLRLEEDNSKDWIHLDNTDTAIIYLSPSNIDSGTNFYDDQENNVASVKFVQGSCVFFQSGIKHKSIGNHGHDIEDGRMTLNVFMGKK